MSWVWSFFYLLCGFVGGCLFVLILSWIGGVTA